MILSRPWWFQFWKFFKESQNIVTLLVYIQSLVYQSAVIIIINKTCYSSPRESTWHKVLHLLFLAALPNLRTQILVCLKVLTLTTEDEWLLHWLLHSYFCCGEEWSQETRPWLRHSRSKCQKKNPQRTIVKTSCLSSSHQKDVRWHSMEIPQEFDAGTIGWVNSSGILLCADNGFTTATGRQLKKSSIRDNSHDTVIPPCVVVWFAW